VYEDVESLHLRVFPDVPEAWKDEGLKAKWDIVKTVRGRVLAEIELHRASKAIGSSLEASIMMNHGNDFELEIGSIDMAEICIISRYTATVIKDTESYRVEFKKAAGNKCARCWKVLPEVDAQTCLCNRCSGAVEAHKKAA
jgi:isoleucyl-tRNA synthetase